MIRSLATKRNKRFKSSFTGKHLIGKLAFTVKMPNFIQIRVTPEQHERIRNKAQAKGYKTITSFIRNLALEKDLVFEQRFDEIYRILTKKKDSSSNPV